MGYIFNIGDRVKVEGIIVEGIINDVGVDYENNTVYWVEFELDNMGIILPLLATKLKEVR